MLFEEGYIEHFEGSMFPLICMDCELCSEFTLILHTFGHLWVCFYITLWQNFMTNSFVLQFFYMYLYNPCVAAVCCEDFWLMCVVAHCFKDRALTIIKKWKIITKATSTKHGFILNNCWLNSLLRSPCIHRTLYASWIFWYLYYF